MFDYKISPVDADRDVLGELVAIVEYHNQVHVELYAELVVDERGAAEYLGEQHVHWDFQVWNHVAIGYLDVLHLSRGGLAFEALHAH